MLNESEFPDIGETPNVDLAILYSVIYHMPSASYVSDVVDYLLKVSPKNLAIRNIFTDAPSWDRSLASYTNRNYLRGNIFNKSEFLKNRYLMILKNSPYLLPVKDFRSENSRSHFYLIF